MGCLVVGHYTPGNPGGHCFIVVRAPQAAAARSSLRFAIASLWSEKPWHWPWEYYKFRSCVPFHLKTNSAYVSRKNHASWVVWRCCPCSTVRALLAKAHCATAPRGIVEVAQNSISCLIVGQRSPWHAGPFGSPHRGSLYTRLMRQPQLWSTSHPRLQCSGASASCGVHLTRVGSVSCASDTCGVHLTRI